MNRLKPYEEYKESNLKWLGNIPAHWKLERGKVLFKKENRNVRVDDGIITCFRDGTVTLRKKRRTSGFTESIKEIGYQGIRKGDLVIHVMDAFAGAIGVSDSDGKGSPVYSVCTPKKDLNNYYYAHIIREMAKRGYIQSLYRGIRERSSDFRFETFANQVLPIPPKEEQDQIVKYLDSKLLKIKRFIKAKKKHIELLREQIEYHLYFDNTSYNSTISFWNTAFPKEWEMIKANRVFKEVKIKDCPEKELLAVTQDRGVVYKKDCEQNYVSPSENLNGLKLVRKNDYVISLRSFQGGIEFSNVEGIVSPAYNVFCLRKEFDKEDLRVYYKYLFKTKAFISLLNTMVSGIRDGKNISYTDFSQILVPLPPKRHLEKIIKLAKQYEVYKNQFENELPLLYEYRTSLISDVVTGKVDVRNIEIQDVDEQLKEGFEDTDDEIIDEEDGEIGEEV